MAYGVGTDYERGEVMDPPEDGIEWEPDEYDSAQAAEWKELVRVATIRDCMARQDRWFAEWEPLFMDARLKEALRSSLRYALERAIPMGGGLK